MTMATGTYSQTIDLNIKNASIIQVLEKIEQETDYGFMFKTDQLNLEKRYSLNLNSAKIETIMSKLLDEKLYSYRIIDRIIVISKKENKNALSAYQNKKSVSGKVTDSSGNPLPGVTVVVKGTMQGTITDVNGDYSILSLPNNTTLQFSFIGMQSQEFVVGSQSTINVQLEVDAIGIEEVVAIGYGSQKKRDITGAVASFDASVLEKRPQTNVMQALQGMVAGLNISTSSSTAEDDASMFIRGENSISASNTPLIVLDGIPYEGGMSSISPNNIKSIEVLKDASSTAIYGSRGANGVILISTKQGTESKLKVSYSGYYSVDGIAYMPDMQDASEYWDYSWERLVTNPLGILTTQSTTSLYSKITSAFSGDENSNTEIASFMQGYPDQTWYTFVKGITSKYDTYVSDYETLQEIAKEFAYPEGGRNTNWMDLATRMGHKQRHNVAISGGTKVVKYYTSIDYYNVEGIAKGDDYQSIVFRINLNMNITDWMKYGTNTSIGFYDRSGVTVSVGGSNGAFVFNPLYIPYNDDGSLNIYPDPNSASTSNPLESLLYKNSDLQKRITTNNYLDIDIPRVKGLNYRLNTGYIWTDRNQKTYYGQDTYVGINNDGKLTISDDTSYDWTIENILSFKRNFGAHKIFLTALYSAQEQLYESNDYTGLGFDNDTRTYYQLGSANTITSSADYTKKTYLSQMLRANYGFDERYLVTATVRRDGYSAFGSSNKFGIFPSIALGWNIANEKFASDWGKIDVLKFRLSLGKNGNNAISAYATLPTMSSSTYIDEDGNTLYGYYAKKLENSDLGWETTVSLNGGLDFTLFGGRVRGSLDAYKSKTSDLLLNETISSLNGTTSITRNIGKTSNRGIELQVSTVNINNDLFSWKTDATLSTYDSEIVDVGLYDDNGNPTDDVSSEWFIGHPVDVNYDYVLDRILQKDDFITDDNNNYVYDDNGSYQLKDDVAEDVVVYGDAFPGKPIVKDINGDGLISGSDDKEIIGKTIPSLTAGMTNTFKYKNWTLSFFLNSVWGITRKNELVNSSGYNGDRKMSDISYWTPDNASTDIPGINISSTTAQTLYLYEKANFVRLQDVTLAYDLPESLLQTIGFSNFSAYINVKNAYTFTNWRGLDPEYSSVRGIPRVRSFILGLRFSL